MAKLKNYIARFWNFASACAASHYGESVLSRKSIYEHNGREIARIVETIDLNNCEATNFKVDGKPMTIKDENGADKEVPRGYFVMTCEGDKGTSVDVLCVAVDGSRCVEPQTGSATTKDKL